VDGGFLCNNCYKYLWLRKKRGTVDKAPSTKEDLGCSVGFLKQHLEGKFYPNKDTNEKMTWANYGVYGWHVDHIKPLSLFDLTDREQLILACHYTNLQPMWSIENIKKGNKYE
jgi:hypothetical protein